MAVGMAVDRVARAADYDCVLLLGGDADLAPAVEGVKDGGKRVDRVVVERSGRAVRPGAGAAPGGGPIEGVLLLREEDLLDEKNGPRKRA